MPIYEFTCESENIVFEKLKKITDNTKEKCPSCGRVAKKIISQSTFHLKGSGWYATDSTNKSKTEISNSGKGTKEVAKESPKETGQAPAPDSKKEAKAPEQKAA
jgi:putative FmdB family regulatory protein